ncbi:lipopolysaccharide assembly protein LapB [Testudinibacter aquarius]|uniref:Lipopolysaccharide assembly protein B n=1 Tax=Testudinibacter aquarius TaxID=1524974 RepID=A0A4R3Y5S2_9PAST|nr:lipopolysaccharide assembly protein LapB [Testudinibacter aquarius]KAE9526305.1 lipopolysaccharide assembly protein LapB [Testudinibacter aquarius]TCV87117.1 lipopolysaccharide biosynthesis regulator YciM [Testudinibacter aquarius]TNG92513.1 lipopolysaccharide assembly protein LapB [Testudinibacter aquarius]
MLELLFLLLPVAALYGWYMGYRNAKKGQDDVSNKLSRDYVTGVNFLLSNQQEKAVDLFLDMLQKQENENDIHSDSQFEASLTLGNLFRSRGEVDRAIRIHQNLVDDPNFSFDQKLLAKQQLAFDYRKVGFFDRAENIYISLVDEPEFADNALEELAKIYQKTKEWKKAVDVTEKRQKAFPQSNNIELAHYYCEYIEAEELSVKEQKVLLTRALEVSPTCVRASIELAYLYMREQDFRTAIEHFQAVLQQNSAFIVEVLPHLKWCYQQLQDPNNYELFLIKAKQRHNSGAVELALAELTDKNSGAAAAQAGLYQQLNHIPSMDIFNRLIQYDIEQAEDGRAKESLIRLQQLVENKIGQSFAYRCSHCGYRSHRLVWNCPSCNKWETIKPVDGQYQ